MTGKGLHCHISWLEWDKSWQLGPSWVDEEVRIKHTVRFQYLALSRDGDGRLCVSDNISGLSF
jgi:hypothetical protein